MAYAGEDLILELTLVDEKGTAINYADAQSVSVDFINCENVIITKTKAGGEVLEGDASNKYEIELQESETAKLKKGNIKVELTITLANANFSDGEATSVQKTEIVLK